MAAILTNGVLKTRTAPIFQPLLRPGTTFLLPLQYKELRAIRGALGRLRGISYALYIILGINLVILAGLAWLTWLALRDVPFW